MVRETGEGVLAALDPGPKPALAPAAGLDAAGDHAWLAGVLPPPPARLLDAGCGDGTVAGWLTGLGYRVTAIDADPRAVARARAAGVPAIQADLVRYADQPFDAVLMLLTLHHMHPLPQALDTVTRLLRPGGRLVIDEFAWDWADPGTIGWFEDIASILIAAGVADPAAGPLSPVGPLAAAGLGSQAARWRARHTEHGTACNPGDAMVREVAKRFGEVELWRVPYLARHLVSQQAHPAVFAELSRIERGRIADGTLTATGFRIIASRAGVSAAVHVIRPAAWRRPAAGRTPRPLA